MNDELARLKADLEVIERYEGRMYALAAAKAEIGNKIDELEAEAADPFREVKGLLYDWSRLDGTEHHNKWIVIHYVDHLIAELAAKDQRIAELEAKETIPLYIENVDTSKHAGHLIVLLTHAILRIDESLKAIERRIDKADDYIQEQNERDIEP